MKHLRILVPILLVCFLAQESQAQLFRRRASRRVSTPSRNKQAIPPGVPPGASNPCPGGVCARPMTIQPNVQVTSAPPTQAIPQQIQTIQVLPQTKVLSPSEKILKAQTNLLALQQTIEEAKRELAQAQAEFQAKQEKDAIALKAQIDMMNVEHRATMSALTHDLQALTNTLQIQKEDSAPPPAPENPQDPSP